MSEHFELIVIGAGPGGYHTAIHAARHGMKVALIEKSKVGGICLNYGCMPTKIMLNGVSAVQEKRSYLNVELNREALFAEREEAIGELVNGISFLLKKAKVKVYKGVGSFLDKNSLRVIHEDESEEVLTFDKAIIATGSVVRTLPFLEKVGKYVIDSDTATRMPADEVPKSILIIGGGVIGVEFAYIYKGLGCDVTIVEAMDRILINEEEITSKIAADELIKRGVKIFTAVGINSVEDAGEKARITFADEILEVDKILCAVGRKSNVKGLNIDALGSDMVTEGGSVFTDEYMETKCSGIYAIGDVNARMMLAHVASAQGALVVENLIKGEKRAWDGSFVPRCVYIEPEIAGVGLVEKNLNPEKTYKTSLYPFGSNGKAIALRRKEGLIKVIAEADTRKIVGITIIGERATELIGTAMEYVKNGMTIDQIENGIYAHPTFSEALYESVMKLDKKATHSL